ncbi:hypothetical protein DFH08DRAFT_978471 [Mycena albidolilacea]|uniref:Uncharacterized protein n=1 Tax=Mycena albidolilacea TaxID=1033008 RepID=A0AAD7E7D3_9AGAR|nr:hypothetical protein DFH08DRAFT_978471 [Mycena albidolilacea]
MALHNAQKLCVTLNTLHQLLHLPSPFLLTLPFPLVLPFLLVLLFPLILPFPLTHKPCSPRPKCPALPSLCQSSPHQLPLSCGYNCLGALNLGQSYL